MEEYIKQVEDIISFLDDAILYADSDDYDMKKAQKDKMALKYLLKRYKELEEENKTYIAQLNGAFDRGFIPISVIQNTLKDIDKKEKEELKGLKGQDRYFVKQMYQYMRKPLDEILEKGNK